MKRFLTNSKNIERDSYIWNMLGTTLMAFQSVILLMILTRAVGLADAGVFTIAYANANLMLVIGKYGMHNYQVSDTRELYSFGDYRRSRWISVALMMLASLGFAVISTIQNADSFEKGAILFWMCAWKAIDAIEDVYCSLYQQKGRLDVAGKLMTVRMIVSLLFFIAALLICRDLHISLIISTIFSLVLFWILNKLCYDTFPGDIRDKGTNKGAWRLLGCCFTLFVIGFLSFYISNAPKYAIDSLLSDELQACYGFIAMPVFVIGLLGNYLFNPLIQPMSEKWAQGDVAWVTKKLLLQSGVVVVITAVCLGGAYLLGIPVLSMLYGTNLGGFRDELLVLLAGGGLLALSNQLMTVITILRRQTFLMIGYGICSALALFLSRPIVKDYSIMGAAVLELVIMLCLCVIFTLLFIIEIHKAKKKRA